MSHHLFIVSPSDVPIYNLTHQSTKAPGPQPHPSSSNLPTWSTTPFASTFTSLTGASSGNQPGGGGGAARVGGGQDRHVVQMIAHASLDVIESVMRTNNGMCVEYILQQMIEVALVDT